MSQQKNPILSFSVIFIIIVAILAGFLGGVLGREYLPESNNLFTREYSIKNPKTIQEKRLEDAYKKNEDLTKSIIGIYLAKPAAGKELSKASIYHNSEAITQGLVLTSDGWVVSYYDKFLSGSKYVAITQEGRIFPITDFLLDGFSDLTFFKLEEDIDSVVVSDFNVFKLGDSNDLTIGEEVYLLNRLGQVIYTKIKDADWDSADVTISTVKETEKNYSFTLLSGDAGKDFYGSPVLNNDGEMIGVIKHDNRLKREIVIPINSFNSVIASLLRVGEINRSSLGIYYLPLSQNFNLGDGVSYNLKKGALVWNNAGSAFKPASKAKTAGLKEKDIIVKIENEEINDNYDLSSLLQYYHSGDKIRLDVLRDGVIKEIDIIL